MSRSSGTIGLGHCPYTKVRETQQIQARGFVSEVTIMPMLPIARRVGFDMDWSTAVGTVLGAVIGTGSAVLSERARWSLGRVDRRRDALKSSCACYLANLAKAVEQIWHAAREHGDGWLHQAMTSMQDHGVQEARFDLSLIAPASVVGETEEVSILLAEWRDIVGAGARQGDDAFEKAWTAYRASRETLLGTMRAALGAE
jgi:hypothetical protein